MGRRHFVPPVLGWIAAAVLLATGCPKSGSGDPWASAGSRPKVLVSFAPLYSFAANVAGPDADVKCLLTSTGPHNHGDASQQQIELARGCDVFIINGLGLEDESDGIVPKLEKVAANPKWNVLNLGTKIDAAFLHESEQSAEHDHGQAAGDHHHHGHDPHVWLSIRCAKRMVEGIRDELKGLDPPHATGYETRAAEYLKKLDRLEAEGKGLLADKKEKTIVSFHESLNYFAETYGLKIAGVIEVSPGQEPSLKKLDEIVKACTSRKPPVRVIAVEPQYPTGSSANAVRNGLRGIPEQSIEAEFAEVDPLETCDGAELGPELYEKVIWRNLVELARVLR
jgi:zinc transport system substrate-binding protein